MSTGSYVDMAGAVVAVTGAARGLGLGISQSLLERNATVVVTDRLQEDADAGAATLESAFPSGNVLPLGLDVTDGDSVDAAIGGIVDRLGRLDGWVNNAGIVTMAPADEISADMWEREFSVNTTGLFLCSVAAARAMDETAGRGAIVNVASNAGKVGFADMAAYNASKAAVINLTRNLAREWSGRSINVNCVCPGGVETPMLRDVAERISAEDGTDVEEIWSGMGSNTLGRRIQPTEVGSVVAFLLSDEAEIIRGQAINVDGGDTPY